MENLEYEENLNQMYMQSQLMVDNPTNVKFIGNMTTICQIVQLLSYIRHAIKNNETTEIKVKIGSKIANSQLNFDVNGLEIPDMITQDFIEIN